MVVGHGPLTTVVLDERHRRQPFGGGVEGLAHHRDDGHAERVGHLRDPADDLAVEGLVVQEPLAGHHQVGGLDHLVQAQVVGHHLEARHQPCPRARQAAGEATRGAAALEGRDVHAVLVEVDLHQPLEPAFEQLDLRGARTLLRREHPCRVDEPQPHVARDLQGDPAVAVQRRHRPQRPEPAVGGRRAADADDDAARPRLDGDRDQLPGAVGRGRDRIVALGPADERQAARTGHLDHRELAGQPPTGLDGVAERSGHRRGAVRATQCVQGAFAPVGERAAHDLVALGSQPDGQGLGGLGRGGGALELVRRHEDLHGRPA